MDENLTHYFNFDFTKLEILQNSFMENPTNFSQLEKNTEKVFDEMKQNFISELLSKLNENICKSKNRKKEWYINRHDKKDLVTINGKITYTKTLFTHKEKDESCYLIDKILDIEPHERFTDEAKTKMLKEAVQTSYRRGGEAISQKDKATKSAVKDMLHRLEFPKDLINSAGKKRVVPILYIEADEDHTKLQFDNEKGDIKRNKKGRKKNGLISKMIYVHEGARSASPGSKRKELINVHYFNCTSEDTDNEEFWNRVDNYIEATYDTSQIQYKVLMADGGPWIKAALDCIPNLIYVMDEFHLNKYLNRISRKFWDSANDIRNVLYKMIVGNNKAGFKEVFSRLYNAADEKDKDLLLNDATYIYNNWNACYLRYAFRDKICGCSAEAHVSHELASRMSSRPMAWSKLGASKMVKLIEYTNNGYSLKELVKYQKTIKRKVSSDINNPQSYYKYYCPDKLKQQAKLTSNEIKQKYSEVISAKTWPGTERRYWLDKLAANF